ncbi:tyrosine-type recombinase/integrase [Thiolapillus brandeum]|uniref:tyrosine-type recombinase/integrase n=1 Tax=Thiolapillus brandeum TaxID=1076588 RepID=UPI00155ADDBC|nr:integrase arm-type DNA-binding domain-containing protein [Thiolapillus brandeum]
MALTNTAIKNAKPREKLYKLYDAMGLYIEITPKGAKRWRFRYRRPGTGKESRLSLGLYPDVTLKAARAKRDEARQLLSDGIDPGYAREQARIEKSMAAENSFQAVATEWMKEHLASKSASYQAKIQRLMERDVFPFIGRRPIAEIRAPEILSISYAVLSWGAENDLHQDVGHHDR